MIEEKPTTFSSILEEYKSLYKEDSDFSDLEDFIEYVNSKLEKEEEGVDTISIDHRTLRIECTSPNFNKFIKCSSVGPDHILEVLALIKRDQKLAAFLSYFPAQDCSRDNVIHCCSRIADAVYNLYPGGADLLSKNEIEELKNIGMFISKLLPYFSHDHDISLDQVLPKVIQEMGIL